MKAQDPISKNAQLKPREVAIPRNGAGEKRANGGTEQARCGKYGGQAAFNIEARDNADNKRVIYIHEKPQQAEAENKGQGCRQIGHGESEHQHHCPGQHNRARAAETVAHPRRQRSPHNADEQTARKHLSNLRHAQTHLQGHAFGKGPMRGSCRA